MYNIIKKFFAFPLLLMLPGLFINCTGERGPKGVSLGDIDIYPPTIRLISPVSNTKIRSDTLFLEAEAYDTLGEFSSGIEYVEFFVNGSNRPDWQDTTIIARVETVDDTVGYSWNFREAGNPNGWITVSALAVDGSNNSSLSPLVILHRRRLEGLDTLEHHAYGGNFIGIHLPGASVIEYDSTGKNAADEDSVFTVSLEVSSLGAGVRFNAPADLRITNVQLQFGFPTDFKQQNQMIFISPSPFLLSIYPVINDLLIPENDDTFFVPVSTVRYGEWTTVNLNAFSEDDVLPFFNKNQDFVVAIHPRNASVEERIGLTLLASDWGSVDDRSAGHSMIFPQNAPEFTKLSNYLISDGEIIVLKSIDLHIRAVVDYDRGEQGEE